MSWANARPADAAPAVAADAAELLQGGALTPMDEDRNAKRGATLEPPHGAGKKSRG